MLHDLRRLVWKGLTFTLPKRFEMEDATKTDAADMMLATLNKVPSFPSSRLNFHLKKYVTQELLMIST